MPNDAIKLSNIVKNAMNCPSLASTLPRHAFVLMKTSPVLFQAQAPADLIAVLVAVSAGTPRVLTINAGASLPSGPFELGHRSLQSGLRVWVQQQTGLPPGYMEQLYTFADQDRHSDRSDQRAVSISYLGLTRETEISGGYEAGWKDWYDYFPWEDRRTGVPAMIAQMIVPGLRRWAENGASAIRDQRWQRAHITFGLQECPWNEDMALQRYELLYEAGLVPEAANDEGQGNAFVIGRKMHADHRRILATGIARLRAKIHYRPVVFELMPPAFTLLSLQRSVEGIAGRLLHKQNFRRQIEQQALVEETGDMAADTGGRPAKLFRFRGNVLAERAVSGSKLPLAPFP